MCLKANFLMLSIINFSHASFICPILFINFIVSVISHCPLTSLPVNFETYVPFEAVKEGTYDLAKSFCLRSKFF